MVEKPTALVSGATGFLGGYIVEKLLRCGYIVKGIARNCEKAKRLEKMGVDILISDLSEIDVKLLEKFIQGVDYIFHTVAKVSDWGRWVEFEKATIETTRKMLMASSKLKLKKFVHISTVDVYDYKRIMKNNARIDESFPCTDGVGVDYYTISKLRAERIVFTYEKQIPFTIIRPATIFGPRDNTILPRMVEFLKNPFAGFVKNYDPALGLIYVTDVADLCVSAAEQDISLGRVQQGRIYNAAPEEDITLREYAKFFSLYLNLPEPKFSYPYRFAQAIAMILENYAKCTKSRNPPALTRTGVRFLTREQRFNINRAKKELGWRPKVEFSKGIESTMTWAQQNFKW